MSLLPRHNPNSAAPGFSLENAVGRLFFANLLTHNVPMEELTQRWTELGSRWGAEDYDSYMAAVARISRDAYDLMSAYRELIAEAEDRFGIYNGKTIEAGALEYEDIMEIQAALEK